MSGTSPIVADVIAGDLVRYGARRCFALLGTANFNIFHALVEAGVDLISARHTARLHERAQCPRPTS